MSGGSRAMPIATEQAVPAAAHSGLPESRFLRYSREYIERLSALMGSADLDILRRVVEELGKAAKRPDRRPIRVMGLTDNVPWLTALANDEGYDRVFAGQLENFAGPADVLIVISASGNSPNLVEAVRLARERGLSTIAFLGFDGGLLKDLVDVPFWLPTERGHTALSRARTRRSRTSSPAVLSRTTASHGPRLRSAPETGRRPRGRPRQSPAASDRCAAEADDRVPRTTVP